jgi:O-antigen ligase
MRRLPPASSLHLRLAGAACLFLAAMLLILALRAEQPAESPAPIRAATLRPGVVANMDSPALIYSAGWHVSPEGADPREPADPWVEPSGVLTFTYTGRDLALRLAPGDYWGYLYITVDGAPANRLAVIPGNPNALGQPAGYRTFYAPERPGMSPVWVPAHRTDDPTQLHTVRVEVWRSWGQTPLRGVAVDALPAPRFPLWPGLLAALVGTGLLIWTWPPSITTRLAPLSRLFGWSIGPVTSAPRREALAALGAALVALAMLTGAWWLALPGLALLAYASLVAPSLWAMAWFFALPFYFSQTVPILPGRATNLIDLGAWGGLAVSLGHWLLIAPRGETVAWPRSIPWTWLLAGWALVSASAAVYPGLALREVRTVFLAAALLSVLLAACRSDPTPHVYRRLVAAWLAGATIMALIGLAHSIGDTRLIEAEGVRRVRALYGSPNNLALYLERGLMVTLALALFVTHVRVRAVALVASAILGAALLLTFSKGALVLGLPAGLAVLWIGGLLLAQRRRTSTRPLWGIAAAAAVALLALAPFLGTERFRNLLDFSQGTGLLRLYLWHSAEQMALDHPWLGVGPDNFLYVFRSVYLLPPAWQEPNLNHPHNWLLDGWTRLGLPGLALLIGWFATGLTGLWSRLWTASSRADAALWLGLLAASIAALAHGLIDLSYAVPDLMLVWTLILGLPVLAANDNGPTSR